MVIGDSWVEQELLEVADQGLHCLAWQSNKIEGEKYKDSSAKVTGSHDSHEGASKNFKMNGGSGEKYGAQESSENTKVEYKCDEETDLFLDAEVEQEQEQAQREQRFPMPEEDEEETHKLFKVQSRDTDEDSAKFFIVQPLDDQQTEQDGVTALMMKKQDLGSSDYEDITDVFRDIEIEDLEAEKENVGGGNGTDVEKVVRENSPLMSKIHYRGELKKLQDTSKVDPCLETYEEIFI